MRRALIIIATFTLLASAGSAFAISDGQYSYERLHCTGAADNSDTPAAQPGCYQVIFTIADSYDLSGHEYLGAGIRQTAEGDFANTADVWIDPGQGTRYVWTINGDGVAGPVEEPGNTDVDPSRGLYLYFSGDDNLDVGEHDSSEQMNNGPSDGGAIRVSLNPSTADGWLAALTGPDAVASLLHNPAPLLSAGTGQCADGVCFALTSHQRVAFQPPAGKSFTRMVADYTGKEWDPENCDGGHDGVATCGSAAHPGFRLVDWANLDGTRTVEPGFQIFEDPDPQSSPVPPYPLPAFYFGSCGFVLGGGAMSLPEGPNVNDAGQFVIATAC